MRTRLPMLFLLLITGIASAMEFTVDTEIILQTGAASPDGNGVFGDAMQPPILNNNGQLLIWSRLLATSNPDMIDDFGFYRADGQQLVTIARGGQPTPAGPLLRLDLSVITAGSPVSNRMYGLAANGDVTFGSRDDSGAWGIFRGAGGPLTAVVRDGDTTSYGTAISLDGLISSLELNDAGDLAYLVAATTSDGPNQILHILSDDSDDQVVLRGFQPLPDGRTAQGLFLASTIGLNNAGHNALIINTNDGPAGFGVYRNERGNISKLMHSGEPAVDGLGSYIPGVTSIPELNDQGHALLRLSVDDVVTDYVGLFFHNGAELQELRRVGDITTAGQVISFNGEYLLNDNDTVAYAARIGDFNRIVLRQNGVEQIIASEGQTLPPPIDLPLFGPFAFTLNDNDQLLFTGFVTADGANRKALFLYDPQFGLALIARTGQPFSNGVLADFNLALPLTTVQSRYRENAFTGFNDLGQAAFQYQLDSGLLGIALAEVTYVVEAPLFKDGFEALQP
ncbi:MAG: hypothetical protein Tsb002_04730 [Wenzhouxiangellaceae bacterium]